MRWWKGALGLERDGSGPSNDVVVSFTPTTHPSRTELDNLTTNRISVQQYDDLQSGGERAILGLSTTWACTNLLAGTQASLPLMVYRTDKDGRRSVAADHPLYRILHDSPNADQTALDFWEFMCACLELHGNAYCEIKRSSNGRVVALAPPIVPALMVVRRAPSGDLFYRWQENGERTETQANVLHIRGFGGSPLGGLSTLRFGCQAFGTALAIDAATRATFRNGVRSSGAFISDKALNAVQLAEAQQTIEEKYAGAMNAGRPLILNNGLKYEALSINPDDAQMLQSRAFSVEEICRFFGVPPFMVGHTEKSTSWGTGIEQQTLGFVKFTLRRRLKRIEQALMKQLLTASDRVEGVTIEFNLEGLLRGDSKNRAEFYRAALGDTQKPGWMVRNEIRRLENLEPIDGWDEPIPLISQAQATEGPAE